MTDITETSTELAAGRTSYRVVSTRPEAGGVVVRLEVADMGAAERAARDVVRRMWSKGVRSADVWIYPDRQTRGSPVARLEWSAPRGFHFTRRR